MNEGFELLSEVQDKAPLVIPAPKLPMPRDNCNYPIGYEIENSVGQRLVTITPYNGLKYSGTDEVSPDKAPLMYGTREEAEIVVKMLGYRTLKVIGPARSSHVCRPTSRGF